MAKRDSKGRFIKGNMEGKKFTKTNQPKNAGRRPSRFKQILEGLESIGETLSLEDYKKVAAVLLTLTPSELSNVAKDKDTPIAVILIANAIGGDIDNKRMDNLDRLLDRLFGKSTNSVDVTSKGDKVSQSIQIEILDGKGSDK